MPTHTIGTEGGSLDSASVNITEECKASRSVDILSGICTVSETGSINSPVIHIGSENPSVEAVSAKLINNSHLQSVINLRGHAALENNGEISISSGMMPGFLQVSGGPSYSSAAFCAMKDSFVTNNGNIVASVQSESGSVAALLAYGSILNNTQSMMLTAGSADGEAHALSLRESTLYNSKNLAVSAFAGDIILQDSTLHLLSGSSLMSVQGDDCLRISGYESGNSP